MWLVYELSCLNLYSGLGCRSTSWPEESHSHTFSKQPLTSEAQTETLWEGLLSLEMSVRGVVTYTLFTARRKRRLGLRRVTSWTALDIHIRMQCVSLGNACFYPQPTRGAGTANSCPSISSVDVWSQVRGICPEASSSMQLLSGCKPPNLRWHPYNGYFGSKTIFFWSSTWILQKI